MEELELDAETMRRLGYAMVDRMVEWQTNLPERPGWVAAERAATESVVRHDAPADGVGAQGFDALVDQLLKDVVPLGARTDHPRFFAFVPGSATWPSVLGDFMAAGLNVFQGTWLASAGVSQLELRILEWFRTWLGLPPSGGGLLLSGGSAANLTALACARQLRFGGHSERAVLYASTETHSSVARAARILGFKPEQVRSVAADDAQRIDLQALHQAIHADRAVGLEPFLVVGNGGTTSTGSVDDLQALAALCRAESLWFHVDAAYGGFAVLTERGRALLSGIDAADSVTLDPHKWLYQPFEVGCLLVRDAARLRSAFHIMPDYLRDTAVAEEPGAPVNFAERGVQLTRYARVIKVWLSLNYFGVDAFAKTIDRTLDHALYAESIIREHDSLELLSPARLGVVCFRRRMPDGLEDRSQELNEQLLRALMLSGRGMISSTRVNGEYALRLCILSFRTTQDDVREVVEFLARHPLSRVG
jgi:glutamate/tyrosine decarboxylase-like PLP-dependent enzyme